MIDAVYKDLISNILDRGYRYEDPNRKGVVRTEIPSYTFRHNFSDGFPAISLKKLAWKSVVTELLWFLNGDTNIKYLVDNGCNIWNKDAYNWYLEIAKSHGSKPVNFEGFINEIKSRKELGYLFQNYRVGDLGKVYGAQWRNWKGSEQNEYTVEDHERPFYMDQISSLIRGLRETPMSTQHIVTAWNPAELDNMALPPCHYGFQIVMKPLPIHKRKEFASSILGALPKLATAKDYEQFLNDNNITKYGFELHWQQRSVDTFLGLPFNIASYALLALILEKITGHKALGIQGDLKKVHLYNNSIEAAKELITRNCSEEKVQVLYKDEFHYITDKELMGDVSINKIIDEMKPDWFILKNYNPQEPLKVEMLSRD